MLLAKLFERFVFIFIIVFVQRLTPFHHSFDEANAYTYAALFFLGGLLVMMVLDRLPMNTYRAIIYEVCFRTVIITLDHLDFPTFVFIFIFIFIQRLTPFHHSFIHSFTTLNWIRQKLIRFEGEAKKSMDLQRDNKTLEGQDPSLTYMVLLSFRWVTWSQIRAKCVFMLYFLL